ncbi:hypothetical protein [Halococcus sediminicola]|uniref:hypothetical protein n=1 Tax=Halococcus sediminicola TaxID=1264579 RepID=UPI0006790205|nr:hypothetical protein [Halococcus sediminicola]
MSELAAAIHDTKAGTEDCTTAMRDALQQRFGFPIELGRLAYIPPNDSVRVTVYPEHNKIETAHQLSRSDDDLQLAEIQGSLTFEFE